MGVSVGLREDKGAMWELISLILLWVIAAGRSGVAGTLAIWIWSRNLTRKMSLLRVFVQVMATIALFVVLLFIPLPWNPILTGLTYSIALRLTIVFVLIAVSTLVLGRFFCGWLCPYALYMDLLSRLRKALKIKYWNLPERLNNALDALRYVLLAGIIVSALVLGVLHPDVWRFVIMFMGPFKPLIIVFLTPIEPLVNQLGGTLGFEMWGTSFHDLSGTIHYFNGELLILITWLVFLRIHCTFIYGETLLVPILSRRHNTIHREQVQSIQVASHHAHRTKWKKSAQNAESANEYAPCKVTEVYEEKGGQRNRL